MAISFQTSGALAFSLRNKKRLREWITGIVETEKRSPGEINYVFTTDNELLGFNQQYLHHNTFTDIITFDYSEKDHVSGDILISIERVKENAASYGAAFDEELRRVMAHGVLHLCGYKDKKKQDAGLMRAKEDDALKRYIGK
jgi:probable rRNA maturation factor